MKARVLWLSPLDPTPTEVIVTDEHSASSYGLPVVLVEPRRSAGDRGGSRAVQAIAVSAVTWSTYAIRGSPTPVSVFSGATYGNCKFLPYRVSDRSGERGRRALRHRSGNLDRRRPWLSQRGAGDRVALDLAARVRVHREARLSKGVIAPCDRALPKELRNGKPAPTRGRSHALKLVSGERDAYPAHHRGRRLRRIVRALRWRARARRGS